MKFHQILLGVVFLTACSSPKYAYHFDHYDYNSGKKMHPIEQTKEEAPLKVDEKTLVVSSDPEPVVLADEKETSVAVTKAFEKYKSLSKWKQKEFRKELKRELKSYTKKGIGKKSDGVESVGATKKFDTLSTLALVFGVAGIVCITLAGMSNAFWTVGVISLVIGAYFFVKWVSNGNG